MSNSAFRKILGILLSGILHMSNAFRNNSDVWHSETIQKQVDLAYYYHRDYSLGIQKKIQTYHRDYRLGILLLHLKQVYKLK
jgi:hypothetical protein